MKLARSAPSIAVALFAASCARAKPLPGASDGASTSSAPLPAATPSALVDATLATHGPVRSSATVNGEVRWVIERLERERPCGLESHCSELVGHALIVEWRAGDAGAWQARRVLCADASTSCRSFRKCHELVVDAAAIDASAIRCDDETFVLRLEPDGFTRIEGASEHPIEAGRISRPLRRTRSFWADL